MSILVTDKAAERIKSGVENQGLAPDAGLRLGVKGGGCYGLSYVIRFEESSKPGDKVFEMGGAMVFVDLKSYLYLKGMTLDWQGDLMQQTLQLKRMIN